MSESMEKTPVAEAKPAKEASKKENAPKKKSFFAGVRSEFKKIIWPDKATVARQTLAVVLVTIVLGVIIVVVDNLIQSGLGFIL